MYTDGIDKCCICYEEISVKEFVLFECKHYTCQECFLKLRTIENSDWTKCPLDRQFVFKVQVSTKSKFPVSTEILLTPKEFKKLKSRSVDLMINIVNSLYMFYEKEQKYYAFIKSVKESISLEDEKFKSNFSEVKAAKSELRNNIIQYNFTYVGLFEDYSNMSESYRNCCLEFLTIFNQYNEFLKSIEQILTICKNITQYKCIDSDFSNIIFKSGDKELLCYMIDDLTNHVFQMKILFCDILAICWKYKAYNNDIYKKFNKNDQTICLICLNKIDNSGYAYFDLCEHRLCLDCILKYKITGCCNIEKSTFNSTLIISYKQCKYTVIDYLSHYESDWKKEKIYLEKCFIKDFLKKNLDNIKNDTKIMRNFTRFFYNMQNDLNNSSFCFSYLLKNCNENGFKDVMSTMSEVCNGLFKDKQYDEISLKFDLHSDFLLMKEDFEVIKKLDCIFSYKIIFLLKELLFYPLKTEVTENSIGIQALIVKLFNTFNEIVKKKDIFSQINIELLKDNEISLLVDDHHKEIMKQEQLYERYYLNSLKLESSEQQEVKIPTDKGVDDLILLYTLKHIYAC